MFIRKRNAQSTAEYAIVIALVIAAILAMQTYVGRGIKKKIALKVDQFGDGVEQYEPYYLDTTTDAVSTTSTKEDRFAGGAATHSYEQGTASTRTIHEETLKPK